MAKEAATSAIKLRPGASTAKPSQHLWVGGIGATVTKEKLEEEFSKFGNIENIKLLKERNIAFIDFVKQDDAFEAVKNLNGKQVGDGNLRVDFVRSHPLRKELQSESQRDPHFLSMGGPDYLWMPQDLSRSYTLPNYGQQRIQTSQSFGGQMEQHPSKVLVVNYPPSVVMDEKLLYSSMILYGEIERIKNFPARSYALIEFRSVEEALRAKESLEGRLLNDPRITMTFSVGESTLVNELSSPYIGIGPRNGVDSLLQLPDLGQPNIVHRRGLSPPATGLLPSPALASGAQLKSKSSGWDVLNVSQLPRESKRPRINGDTQFDDPSTTSGKGDNSVMSMEGGFFGPSAEVHGRNRFDMPDVTVSGRENGTQTNIDFTWRGVIAKGGTIICQARCIPIGQGIQCKLPDVINCSAKTGLDMLTEHYGDAVGFEVSFFLPDNEDDFGSYTEFLQYLRARDRAGVARFDDGTALFLVPPSDFLRNVLNVVGPERLYGVVLKSRQQVASDISNHPMPSIHSLGRQQDPSYDDCALGTHKEQGLQLKYSEASAASVLHQKTPFPTTTESLEMRSVSQHPFGNNKSSLEHAGVKLTPELVASLAFLLPANAQASVGRSSLPPPSYGTGELPAPMLSADGGTSQGWNQQYPYFQQTLSQQHGAQPNALLAQPLTNSHALPVVSPSSSQIPTTVQSQSISYPLLQQVATPGFPNTHSNAVQSQNLAGRTPASQLHQYNVPQNTAQGLGPAYRAMTTGSYGFPDAQQLVIPGSFNNHITAATVAHANATSGLEGKVISEPMNQVNVGQPVSSVSNQGVGEDVVDKDQRYQSTLQFAANLLMQIQQRQQEQRQLQQGTYQAGPSESQQ